MQPPVHFELVAESMANQYTVKPLELVSTVPRLVFALFSVAVDADAAWLLWLDAAVDGANSVEPDRSGRADV